MSPKIGIVGTGNVAWHLSKRLTEQGLNMVRLYGRQKTLPSEFKHLNSDMYEVLGEKIQDDLDVVILAVQDEAILELVSKLKEQVGIVCHTSGTVDLESIQKEGRSGQTGIFYPLYSFRKASEVDWAKVPILIEAENQEVLEKLKQLAKAIGGIVKEVSSEERAHYHVAAVFVNNYTNLMYDLADEYLETKDLSMDVLYPIIRQTAERISTSKPFSVQTGPALRNDHRTLENHMDALKDLPDSLEIYRFLANHLKKRHS